MKVNDIGVIQFLNVISRALLIHFSILVFTSIEKYNTYTSITVQYLLVYKYYRLVIPVTRVR